jgi:predicted NAD/FAD-binding protein
LYPLIRSVRGQRNQASGKLRTTKQQMTMRSIAVIGSGISGLGAAWLLSRRHEVTLIEREPRLGGHSNTVTVAAPEGPVPIDTGFIVYNEKTYPNLIALFAHLGVATSDSNMSFAVSLEDGGYEYAGGDLAGLFGQRSNLVSLAHWQLIRDALRFFREAHALAAEAGDLNTSLGDWLAARGYSDAFVDRHILPMAAAIWSAPASTMLDFPVASFARFFSNHGLLSVSNRPQWRTVVGGSRAYVERLAGDTRARTITANPAVAVERRDDGALVRLADGEVLLFDAVVLACHADEALALLGDADGLERRLLSSFRYSANTAVLHTDRMLMPRRRRVWSSWNVIDAGSADRLSVTYWMNLLQPLATARDHFVTLNPCRPVGPGCEIARFAYAHPIFDREAMAAQQALWSLQGRRRTWFAGSYFGYGFHEDGLQAGLAVAEEISGVARPWQIANPNGRISQAGGGRGVGLAMAAQ